jgi:hypothetical protein
MNRRIALVIALLAICLGMQGCSSSSQGGGGEDGACAFGVIWHGVTYTDVLFRYQKQGITSRDIQRPMKPGRYLGVGKVPKCGGEGPAGQVALYETPGIPVTVAVMTKDRQIGIAEGQDIPDALIKGPAG